jgi:soluble lytic murein transglycosylase-like protein
MPRTPSRRSPRRVRIRALAVIAALALAVTAFVVLTSDHRRLAPGAGSTGETYDPLAFEPGRQAEFERRAAAGLSQPLYAKSPGGAAASAARTARWRPLVERTAKRVGTDPDLIEALVFLESAGRPDAIAGGDLEGAAGLTQILAGTGSGLLAMHVDVPQSRRLTRRIARAERRGQRGAARRLRAARRRVDERFDPAKAIAATGRYIEFARKRFGRDDLSFESYHMGVGNLETALAAFGEGKVPYARLYFDSTPLLHPRAYRKLAALGDDSATYLWRLYAAREIMRLHRDDPGELDRLARLHTAKASAEEVLHPRSATKVFERPADVARERATGSLLDLPGDPAAAFLAIDGRMGELAPRVDAKPGLYRALRPEALATLVYIAAGTHEISGASPLVLTSTVRDRAYQRALVGRNSEATRAYSLHTTGYSFDIERTYRSRRQAVAFQFMLDRLTALNLIAWVVEPRAIHVTVSSDADRLEHVLDDLP